MVTTEPDNIYVCVLCQIKTYVQMDQECTHVDGDSRELEDGDLLVLVAGDEAEELMPVL